MANNTTTTISFNAAAVTARLATSATRAQRYLDNEVLKDCTPYVPRITGALEQSGIDGTVIGSGLIVYNSPYARSQYYGEFTHSTQSHSQASREWFEVAKAAHGAAWIAGVKTLGGA
jgi:hypothetical protein